MHFNIFTPTFARQLFNVMVRDTLHLTKFCTTTNSSDCGFHQSCNIELAVAAGKFFIFIESAKL